MRLGALFVAVCMTVIAASAGVVLYFAYGFSGAEAIIIAIAALTALALYNAVSTHANVRSVVGPQLADLSRSNADLARQLAEAGRRLAAVEAKLERSLAKGEATAEPLAFEISELGALVDQLAESVSTHESRLGAMEQAQRSARAAALQFEQRLEAQRLESQRLEPQKLESPMTEPQRPEPLAAEPPKPFLPIPEPPRSSRPEPPPKVELTPEVLKALLSDRKPQPPTRSEPPRLEPFRAEPPKIELPPPAPAESVALPPLAAPARALERASLDFAIAGEQAPAPSQPAPALAPAIVPLATAPLAPPAPVASAVAARERLEGDSRVGREMLAAVRGAVEGNRIDLHLQPIVTLPQRKVRFYEAMSRLRTPAGDVVMASEFISQAESSGLMPRIDNLVAFRCVQVLRRLLLKNREVGLFCNLSVATLTDAVVFPQLLEFLDANRAIAPSLVLEFTQGALRGAGPIETESLAALRACGYSFSMDNVTNLRIEPRELASRGFRFVKLRANLILNRGGISADIHPGDLADLLGRYGIDLIAEKIESEGAVVDLLDCDVKFGQGFLFSPPRPVRAEALQSGGDRNDVAARPDPGAGGGKPKGATVSAGVATAGAEARTGPRSSGLTKLARRV
jgi:cyclic-di-GMP phosphodiesterase, flagellum assembly factor TipF